MTDSIRPFTKILRAQGFKRVWRDRAGGVTVTQFHKREGNRSLAVQFWETGDHRVSHGTHSMLPNGIEGYSATTPPTEFKTVPEMLAAVEAEWSRPSVPAGARSKQEE